MPQWRLRHWSWHKTAPSAAATQTNVCVVPLAAGAIGWLFKQWSGRTRAFRRNARSLGAVGESSPNPVRRAVDAIERSSDSSPQWVVGVATDLETGESSRRCRCALGRAQRVSRKRDEGQCLETWAARDRLPSLALRMAGTNPSGCVGSHRPCPTHGRSSPSTHILAEQEDQHRPEEHQEDDDEDESELRLQDDH